MLRPVVRPAACRPRPPGGHARGHGGHRRFRSHRRPLRARRTRGRRRRRRRRRCRRRPTGAARQPARPARAGRQSTRSPAQSAFPARPVQGAAWAAETARLAGRPSLELWAEAARPLGSARPPPRCGVLPLARRPGRPRHRAGHGRHPPAPSGRTRCARARPAVERHRRDCGPRGTRGADLDTGQAASARSCRADRDRGRAAGPVGADRARRRPVADQLHPGVGDRGGAVELDPAVHGAQPERPEVGDRRAEAGGPQDHVHRLEGAVGPAHPVGLDRGRTSGRPRVGAQPLRLALLLPERQPGHAHDAGRREAAPYPVLHQRHRGPARLAVEVVRPPHRRPPGHPHGAGDRGDLPEQLDRPRRRRRRPAPGARGSARDPGSRRCAAARRGRSRRPGSAARTAGSRSRSS